MSENFESPNRELTEAQRSSLEQKLFAEYLQNHGYQPEDLQKIPQAEANKLIQKARQYATLKLAEIEARAKFRKSIRTKV